MGGRNPGSGGSDNGGSQREPGRTAGHDNPNGGRRPNPGGSPGDDDKMSLGEKLASALGIGGDAFIQFDPNDNGILPDGSPLHAASRLAHEVAHAYLQIDGRNPWLKKGRELDATAVDNQYRDYLGVDQRDIYGKGKVDWNAPQYNSDTGKYAIHGTGKPYRLRKVR